MIPFVTTGSAIAASSVQTSTAESATTTDTVTFTFHGAPQQPSLQQRLVSEAQSPAPRMRQFPASPCLVSSPPMRIQEAVGAICTEAKISVEGEGGIYDQIRAISKEIVESRSKVKKLEDKVSQLNSKGLEQKLEDTVMGYRDSQENAKEAIDELQKLTEEFEGTVHDLNLSQSEVEAEKQKNQELEWQKVSLQRELELSQKK